jgi:uncharacterized protein YndB with AHSA1/START domain
VRRSFGFPREKVFDAWTNPKALAAWFGGAAVETVSAEVDLRVGGAWRLSVRAGTEFGAVEGVYLEIDPPRRVSYSWRWERPDGSPGRESLVTVDFVEEAGGTEVIVTHEGLRSEESLVFHRGGWTASLEELARLLR